MKLSDKDRKNLERFVKNFAYKYVQVVVQSRQGEPQKTSCRLPADNGDWFLLNVPDLLDITEEARRVLGDAPHKSLSGSPLCVELSLRTPEGESMVLEIWELALLPETESPKSVYDSYNRMIILLKSLLAITRVVPAFRLAQNQNVDTFILHYQLYMGPMQEETCGENSGLVTIGQVGTSLGTLSLSVRYRTKLIVTNKEKQSNEMPMLKSNYFDQLGMEQGQFEGKAAGKSAPGARRSLKNPSERPTSLGGVPCSPASAGRQKELNECSPYGAFASEPREVKDHDLPEDLCDMFSTLLLEPDETGPIEEEEEKVVALSDEEQFEDAEDPWGQGSPNSKNNKENFVYVDLKPAFAEHSSDLGIFFSGAPPPLKSLYGDEEPAKSDALDSHRAVAREPETLEQQVLKLQTQLENIHEIDQFFKQDKWIPIVLEFF
ncbi:autophagy-related protein 13-like isoform X3 [Varroa jacobsoni]|uniref:Autophagy-related protein 13 n=1 Tax=Varroa destructor TaxID=109461 RepID=A0A7M7KGE3_VARDE|nr:autophagy-related protein 13-like isoform X1 [Varroa destructor]XP_022666418.1 autophagy-related protein 13-like isoform X1 [Varroa destructor]XP_022666419.1 autophagy-related protein 13-like isoform X1 [Varroa destructor]XP_022666420.1 autophagy-related protein 13-like isoform X1 [Varroa destructor]XP_022666421.1 autophagy-related protein 13-like isoform X1 [Varroa destructor]XP_022666422.1 autophagy-related protein 13-like isoform X1 [Varroa destructor]XP_022666423.1 autophagy-related pr